MQSISLVFVIWIVGAFGQEFIYCPGDQNPCQNEAPCVGDGVFGDYTCQCRYGWAGKNCDINTFQNCGYNLFERSGTLTSPNYPLDYGFSQNCHYYVRVHGAKQLTFTVHTFDTEFGNDALQYAPGVVWNFTGNYTVLEGNTTTVPSTFTVKGSDVWFVFESDRNIERQGFLITYEESDPSNCASNLCQNRAGCTDLVDGGYFCTCPLGFGGTDCEINIDDCVGMICPGSNICVDGIGSYTCRCPPGYEGQNCDKSCIKKCPHRLRPKCGSDGLTYRNRCYLRYAQCMDPSITMVATRPCTGGIGPIAIIGGMKRTCIQNEGGDSDFSSIERVNCPPPTTANPTLPPNQKTTTTKPCPLVFEPVCGSDGETYPSLCTLKAVQSSIDPSLVVLHQGECIKTTTATTTACRGDCSQG